MSVESSTGTFSTIATEPELTPLDLATTIETALRDNSRSLMVLDRRTNEWQEHRWHAVYELGRRVATDLLIETAKVADSRQPPPVGLIGEPSAEFAAIVIGSWLAGRAVSVLPGPVRGASADSWAQATTARLADTGCRIAYSSDGYLEQLRKHSGPLMFLDIKSVAALRTTAATHVDVPAEHAAILQGTAGSTGAPKTAVQSRRAVLRHFQAVAHRLRLRPEQDVLCSWLPLYHDLGLLMLVLAMCSGTTLWLTSPAAFSRSPLSWIDWLSRSKATMLPAPNFAYDLVGRFARRIGDADLSPIRLALNGGEPVDCLVMERFGAEMERFGFDPNALTPAYGLAEATCGLTMPEPGRGLRFDHLQPADESAPIRHVLLGRPFDGVEVRIGAGRAETQAVAERKIGEVEFRGPTTMSGYLGEDRALGPRDWCPTGDIGYLCDGELVICGRLKEMMTFAGRNLFPQQIEGVAARVPGIDNGAVVATSVKTGTHSSGQRAGLVIVAEYRGSAEHGLVTDQICELVASECGVIPASVKLVARGTLPRTTSGKLRRLAVGEWFGQN